MSKLIPDAVMQFWKEKMSNFPAEVSGAQRWARDSAVSIVNVESRLTMVRNSIRVQQRQLEEATASVVPLTAAATALESKAKAAADRLAVYQASRGDEIIRAVMAGSDAPRARDTELAIEASEIGAAAELACTRRDEAVREIDSCKVNLREKVNQAMCILRDVDAAKHAWHKDQMRQLQASMDRFNWAVALPGERPFRSSAASDAVVDRVQRDAPEILGAYELLS